MPESVYLLPATRVTCAESIELEPVPIIYAGMGNDENVNRLLSAIDQTVSKTSCDVAVPPVSLFGWTWFYMQSMSLFWSASYGRMGRLLVEFD